MSTKSMRLLVAAAMLGLVTACSSGPAAAQTANEQRLAWNRPAEPFTILDNIHYVGAAGVSAFLITTPAGHVLIDGGLPETAAQIAQNITRLGFKIADVEYLLNSHAHFDHAGGLAELKRLSGATLVASGADAGALQAGSSDMPAVPVDRVIGDGDTVGIGTTTLTALLTPGHTPGCTTWTMTAREGDRERRVLFHCSTSVVAPLAGNTEYPRIVEDYERTFARLRQVKADVFLGNHPAFFDLEGKRKRQRAGGANPFVDASELGRFVQASEREFRAALKQQQSSR